MTIELVQCLALALQIASKDTAPKSKRSEKQSTPETTLPRSDQQRRDTASFYTNILNS